MVDLISTTDTEDDDVFADLPISTIGEGSGNREGTFHRPNFRLVNSEPSYSSVSTVFNYATFHINTLNQWPSQSTPPSSQEVPSTSRELVSSQQFTRGIEADRFSQPTPPPSSPWSWSSEGARPGSVSPQQQFPRGMGVLTQATPPPSSPWNWSPELVHLTPPPSQASSLSRWQDPSGTQSGGFSNSSQEMQDLSRLMKKWMVFFTCAQTPVLVISSIFLFVVLYAFFT